MKRICMLFLFMFVSFGCQADGEMDESVIPMYASELPDDKSMDGRVASLIGYLHVDQGAALVFTYDDFLKVNLENSIDIAYTLNDPYELIEKYKDCLVLVVGRLRFSKHRKSYSLHDVRSISLIGRNDLLCRANRNK